MSAVEFTEEDLAQKAASVAARVITQYEAKRPQACEVALSVAREHGLTVEELLSRRRTAHIARARQAFYDELRRLGWSFPAIGAFIGRDHATVMYGVRAHRARGRAA